MIIEDDIENWSEELDLLEEELEEDFNDIEDDIIEESISFNKKGEIRKRKPKTSINYFTDETQNSIIKYLQSNNTKIKNTIYKEKIHPAFYKLCENIIHTFKFYYTEVEDLEDLKYEVMSILIEKIHLYHHSKNINDKLNKIINKTYKEKYINGSFISYTNNSINVTQEQINSFINSLNLSESCLNELRKITPPKAYSYFGTIAKRYLINYNKINYKRVKNQTDPLEADFDYSVINDLEIEYNKFDHSLENFYNLYIEYMDNNLEKIFHKEKELEIAGAVLAIFKNQNLLNLTDKKAIYLYIKEIIEVPTRYITKVLKEFNRRYKKSYIEYEKYGVIKLKNE